MTKKDLTLYALVLIASLCLNIFQVMNANHEREWKIKAAYYLIKRDKAQENWKRIEAQQELNNTLYEWFGGQDYVGD